MDDNHCSGDRFDATMRQQCGDMGGADGSGLIWNHTNHTQNQDQFFSLELGTGFGLVCKQIKLTIKNTTFDYSCVFTWCARLPALGLWHSTFESQQPMKWDEMGQDRDVVHC